jgi:chemotaxis protein MotB
VSRVVGLSSSVLFDRANPRNPINRRISIVVLTKEAEQEAQKTDVPTQVASSAIGTADGETVASAAPASAVNGAGARSAATTEAGTPIATSAGPALAMAGARAEPGTPGPINPMDKPVNPPMGAAPIALPDATAKSSPASSRPATPAAPAPATAAAPAAPKHPIPTK